MTEAQKDTQRSIAAAKVMLDGRDPKADGPSILTTLEGFVALVLLSVMKDERTAAAMLNEALVQGIEQRIALHASRK